jgi:hypothetical protein
MRTNLVSGRAAVTVVGGALAGLIAVAAGSPPYALDAVGQRSPGRLIRRSPAARLA